MNYYLNFHDRKQVHGFLKYFGISFMWSFFQWFYTGGPVCGFVQFPTFGLKAWKQTYAFLLSVVSHYNISVIIGTQQTLLINVFSCDRFFFDFSLTYVGAGMICSHLVNLSTLLGAVLSWGILWPLISKQKGVWYPADVPASSMKSLYGYKVSTLFWSSKLINNRHHLKRRH